MVGCEITFTLIHGNFNHDQSLIITKPPFNFVSIGKIVEWQFQLLLKPKNSQISAEKPIRKIGQIAGYNLFEQRQGDK